MGAIIGMQIAAEDGGERVKAVVLEDPPLYLSEFFRDWMWYPYYPVAVEALKAGLSEAEIVKALSDKLDFAEVDAEKEAKSLVRIDPEIVYRVHDRSLFKEFNADSDLKNIACPLLLLHGEWENGSAMRPEDVRRAAAFPPKGSIQKISGTGHSIHIANCRPDMFNQVVEEFLTRL
jgi:pimeloyl-ACP methyl ester carboxylesterase